MKKFIRTILVFSIISMVLSITVFAQYNEYFVNNDFRTDLTLPSKNYTAKDLGVNDAYYDCLEDDGYVLVSNSNDIIYNVGLQKQFLFVFSRVGSDISMPANSSGVWCARWVNANPTRNKNFRFIYFVGNNWEEGFNLAPKQARYVGSSTLLSEY